MTFNRNLPVEEDNLLKRVISKKEDNLCMLEPKNMAKPDKISLTKV